MVRGPCLCGDIYCPHCGDPGAAELEAAEEHLCEELSKINATPQLYNYLAKVAPEIMKLLSKMVEESVNEIMGGYSYDQGCNDSETTSPAEAAEGQES